MKKTLLLMVISVVILMTACRNSDNTADDAQNAQSADRERIKLATTTSTDNSGLLDYILPVFTAQSGIYIDVIGVGTGKALALGESGDVDIILVHARERELRFVADGFGVNRRDVMYNDFVILGLPDDPAGIRGMDKAASALKQIAASESGFISRGDESGTHIKELRLWDSAGIAPEGIWYREAGQGMGTVITMADDIGAYTLADRGTYLSMKENLQLEIIVAGDPELFNPYGVIAVNPERHGHAKYLASMRFIAFLTSIEGQGLIGGYMKQGEQLFYPRTSY